MTKFKVELCESNYKYATVEADSEAEALEKAKDMYSDGEILMDDSVHGNLEARIANPESPYSQFDNELGDLLSW